MVCYAVQDNQLKPTRGTSGLQPHCVTTLVGSFSGSQAMKTCYQCKKTKLLSSFSKDRNKKDGYCIWCKSCTSDYHKLYAKTDKCKAAAKIYRLSERGRLLQKKGAKRYYQTEKGKASLRRGSSLFRARHHDRTIAASNVNEHVLAGKIPRPDSMKCSCGDQARHYHHFKGYAKENWFDVIAVCPACHGKLHRNKLT